MTEQKYKVKLTAQEMTLIKTSIEQTAYAGAISETVTKIKKKLTPPKPTAPVHVLKEGEK
jgi:hypothetical protein